MLMGKARYLILDPTTLPIPFLPIRVRAALDRSGAKSALVNGSLAARNDMEYL